MAAAEFDTALFAERDPAMEAVASTYRDLRLVESHVDVVQVVLPVENPYEGIGQFEVRDRVVSRQAAADQSTVPTAHIQQEAAPTARPTAETKSAIWRHTPAALVRQMGASTLLGVSSRELQQQAA